MPIYGIFGGLVREVAPIPAAGATDTPTVEVLCEDPLGWYSRQPARFGDSLIRSQFDYRIAALDAIGENHARRNLAMEPATLPISSADSQDALNLLSSLNGANGTRHFSKPAADKTLWYEYTSRNRQYKLGAAADITIDAGSQHVTAFNGWRLTDDPVVNQQRATIDTISFPPVLSVVWTYPSLPLTITADTTLWANFSDYVKDPILDETDGGGLTFVMTPFGHSAKLDITGTGTISRLSVKGTAISRAPTVTVQAPQAADEPTASQDAYGVRAGGDITGMLVGAEASAQGIVNHIVWRYAQPLKRPQSTIANFLPEMFSVDLYDLVSVTVAQLDVAAMLFEITGLSGRCDMAAVDADGNPVVLWTIDWQLQEQVASPGDWFTMDASLMDGPDLLTY